MAGSSIALARRVIGAPSLTGRPMTTLRDAIGSIVSSMAKRYTVDLSHVIPFCQMARASLFHVTAPIQDATVHVRRSAATVSGVSKKRLDGLRRGRLAQAPITACSYAASCGNAALITPAV